MAEAKTIHGGETRKVRTERSIGMAKLVVLEEIGHTLGFMSGARTRSVKPHKTDQVLQELQEAAYRLHIKVLSK